MFKRIWLHIHPRRGNDLVDAKTGHLAEEFRIGLGDVPQDIQGSKRDGLRRLDLFNKDPSPELLHLRTADAARFSSPACEPVRRNLFIGDIPRRHILQNIGADRQCRIKIFSLILKGYGSRQHANRRCTQRLSRARWVKVSSGR